MTTFQEYLNQKYSTKEDKEKVKEIIVNKFPFKNYSNTLTYEQAKELEGEELNLSEYPNLKTIIIDGDCLKSKLTSLDLSNCSKLIQLGCSRNQLTKLLLTNCLNLKELYCTDNQLTELNTNYFPNLEFTYCKNNKLTELNLEKNSQLKEIDCSNNQISKLDLNNNSQLKEINCSQNKLINLNINKCSKIEELKCYKNPIASPNLINFSNYSSLKNFQWTNNAQDYLDLNYPQKQRWSVENLNLSNLDLEGDLDLNDFRSLLSVDINGNPHLGKIINNKTQAPIIINAQDWLNWKYPNKKEVRKIKKEREEIIEGELTIADFPNLEEISFWVSLYKKKPIKLQIINCPQLVTLSCLENEIMYLGISNCPNLRGINCSENLITELNFQNCPNLGALICNENQLKELNLQNLPNLWKLECYLNFLTSLDLSKNQELEILHIGGNNFPEQDLSFLSHLVNLKELGVGNFSGKERIEKGIYNHFIGSLEPLKNMANLEHLDIRDTDLNSGIEYLPSSLGGMNLENKDKILYSASENLQSKVKEIAWQLDLFASKKQKKWEEFGFTLKEIKQWIEAGLKADDYDFVDYLKNEKKLSPQEIDPKEILWNGKLRKEYEPLSWKDIHEEFAPELRKEWEEKGFSHERTKEWVKKKYVRSLETAGNPELKPEESNLAKYLYDKGIEPREAVLYIDELREEYNNSIKEENNKSLHHETNKERKERLIAIGNWENIHWWFKKDEYFNYQKHWEELGFDYQQTEEWIDKKFHPADHNLAYYLKTKGHKPSQLLTSDLIKLKREYHNQKNYLEFWYPVEKRKNITKLDLDHKNLNGDLIIDGKEWENLEEINCSHNSFSSTALNNLPKLKSFIAQYCGINNLVINNCSNLQKINVSNNQLRELNFLQNCNPESLINLTINSNKFTAHDLSFFNKFKNLEVLNVGNDFIFSSEKANCFYGSLEPLKDLPRLKQLNISNTSIDQGLEYLPDNLEIIQCKDREISLPWGEIADCSKIKEELKDYYLGRPDSHSGYNFRVWKENQAFFKLLTENLIKTNPSLTDVREFLQQHSIFFNVRANTFQGNLQGLTSLFQLNKSFFEEKELKIFFLESQIQELTNLIKNQKQKIVDAYLFLSSEKELLKGLVTTHLEFTKFKSQAFDSSDYDEQCEEHEEKCQKIRKQLRSKVSKEEMNETRRILTDCEELVSWELELEAKLSDKSKLIEGQKELLQITGDSGEEKNIGLEDQLKGLQTKLNNIQIKKTQLEQLLSNFNPKHNFEISFWLKELFNNQKKAINSPLQFTILENSQNKLLELGIKQEQINKLIELQKEIKELKVKLKLEAENNQQAQIQQTNLPNFQK